MLIMSCNEEPRRNDTPNYTRYDINQSINNEVPTELRKSQELTQDYNNIVEGNQTMT